ncbi:MAG: hypothetical protein MI724_10060 [Spirochaetales bacterium]|nr:hypothetical protein [Spirochaetales bacterium]
MSRLICILAISLGGLLVGYVVRRLILAKDSDRDGALRAIAGRMKILTLVVLVPIPIVHSFWRISIDSWRLLVFPLMGLAALSVGGYSVLVIARRAGVPSRRRASMFTTSAMTNLGIMGGLVGFVLYGEYGFALVQLYTMFEFLFYYAVVFPASDRIANGAAGGGFSVAHLLKRPISVLPLSAIVVSYVLKWSGIQPPALLSDAAAATVPLMSAIMTISIGLTLQISRIARYRREIGLIMASKHLIVPLVTASVGILLGLGEVNGGVPLAMLMLLSAMPVAFTAMVPPALYGFDLDLANGAWFVSMVGLIVVLPAMYLLTLLI